MTGVLSLKVLSEGLQIVRRACVSQRWYLEDVEVDRWLPLPHDPRVVQSLAFIRGLHRPQSLDLIEDLPK